MKLPQLSPPRRFGLVAAVVIILDQLTKRLVVDAGTIVNAGPLRVGTVYNREGVLGLPIGNGLLVLLGVLIVAFFGYLLTRSTRPEVRAGLWLLLAGAASNTLDRIQYDGVLDIVAFGPSAHFNLGDCSILVGAAVLIFSLWRRDRDA